MAKNRAEMGEEAWLAKERRRDRKRTHGISLEIYNDMLEVQGGTCAICNLPCKTGKSLAVDHSHDTGAIRGLLCINCNTGLGHFKDNLDLLSRAMKYLG